MTSRHTESSRKFSSTTGNRKSADDFWDFDLPISRKGRFFDDSFFESSRFGFDKKVNEILDQWGDEKCLADRWADDVDFHLGSNFSRYRNLRSKDLRDDNQAMTVTSDDTAHKIVLDVQDFVNGEMKVKVVGERELAVEGRLADNRSFRRRFALPQNTDMDAISSVMSADGILTITAPQKGSKTRESTNNKGSGASKTSTTERCHTSTESRSEGGRGRGEGDATTTSSRTERSQQSTTTSGFRDVPFMKRGRFFDDSFFESSRFDFDKKVNEILKRWGEDERLADRWADEDADLLLNNFNRYRNLRSRDLRDDNQAMTVTSDDTVHKIVLDVQDFVNGEMKVKVVGDLELAVEGRLDDNRTFRRRFALPQNTDMDAISSVMSADGILTITAPQKVKQMKDGKTLPIHVPSEGSTNFTSSSTTATTTQKAAATSTTAAKQAETQQNERLAESTQEVSRATPVKTPVEETAASSSQGSEAAQQSSQSYTQTESSTVTSSTQTPEAENVAKQDIQNKTISTQTSIKEDQEERRGRRRSALPITRRGQFFNDSYFEGTWKDYQDAVREVLAKWDDQSAASSDDMTSYRMLRSRDMRDENQAIKSAEDSSSYKFVLDVHDFVEGGDISVNVVDEMELVVEGKVERDSGGARSCNHFLRQFTLPGDVHLDGISSVMSSDGVLTIIAPKMSSRQQLRGEEESVSSTAEKKLHQAVGEVEKLAYEKSHQESASSASASTLASSSVSEESSAAARDEDVVIPVQYGAPLTTSMGSAKTQQVIIEDNANLNRDEDYKKAAGDKHCVFVDESEVDAAHRRMEEEEAARRSVMVEDDDDDSKSGMASLRKLLEEDESYIKHKNRTVPISGKGFFFEDGYFCDWRDCFLTAVKDMLLKYQVPSSEEGDLAAYRQLRQRDLKLENQAAYVDENLRAHTIVLDVYDFLEGVVTAEVKEGRELIVKGTAQRREGPSLITLTFVRPFRLPDNADLKNITAFLASDGVLLVNVPRLQLPYELPDLGGARVKETRPRLSTPCDNLRRLSAERNARDSSTEMEGVTYRISPHRSEHSTFTRDRSGERH